MMLDSEPYITTLPIVSEVYCSTLSCLTVLPANVAVWQPEMPAEVELTFLPVYVCYPCVPFMQF